MVTVHHLNNSRSQRILWLLEELNANYVIVHYQRDEETMPAPNSLKKIHPHGKSPTIVDNDFTLVESGAIIEFILDHFNTEKSLTPDDDKEIWKAKMWLHYAEGSIINSLIFRPIFNTVLTDIPFFVKPISKKIVQNIDEKFLNEQVILHTNYPFQPLENKEFFIGSKLSFADIAMIFPLKCIAANDAFGILDSHLDETFKSYVRRIQNRPACKRAIEKGGTCDYLVA